MVCLLVICVCLSVYRVLVRVWFGYFVVACLALDWFGLGGVGLLVFAFGVVGYCGWFDLLLVDLVWVFCRVCVLVLLFVVGGLCLLVGALWVLWLAVGCLLVIC